MPSPFTKHISIALIGVAILSSCSRPVAYFQRGSVDPSSQAKTQTEATAMYTKATEAPAELLTQASTTVSQIEAFVRNDSKLATDKKLNKRVSRIKNLLASTPIMTGSKASQSSHRMNVAERLILKKMNKQIGHQLAPNHPEKALVKTGQLIGSVILLIAGLILLIAGSGTVAFIGLIVALIGALGTIVSLLGIDS